MKDKEILEYASEGEYKIETMAKMAKVASTANGLTIEGNNFKVTALTGCPDMLLYACSQLVELTKENEKLKAEIKYVDAKVKSATQCHPRAVEYLLDEALSRTHFDNANEVPE
jgi:hypothetical protein